ncbi:MAG: transporter substrate-binding domain-containing protein [Magnetococcales bacterium]|nr:transporter substrate-binding domain-containing protein [Magnetococcales bacterium]
MNHPPARWNIFLVALMFFVSPQTLRSEEAPSHIKITEGSAFSQDLHNLDDTLRIVYEPMGVRVEIQSKPWAHMINDMVSDESVDAIMATYKSGGLGLIFPRWPIYSGGVGALFRKDHPKPWQGMPTLAHQRLGWVKGYFLYPFLDLKRSEMNVQELSNLAQCIRMLVTKRIDYCLDEFYVTIPKTLRAMGLEKRFKVELLFNEPVFLTFKDRPRSHQLIDIFDRRMTQLYRSGRLKEIYSKAGLIDTMPRDPDLFPESLDYRIKHFIDENPVKQPLLQ